MWFCRYLFLRRKNYVSFTVTHFSGRACARSDLPCGNIILSVAVLAIIITAPLGAFGIDSTYKRFLVKEENRDGRK